MAPLSGDALRNRNYNETQDLLAVLGYGFRRGMISTAEDMDQINRACGEQGKARRWQEAARHLIQARDLIEEINGQTIPPWKT